MYGHRMRYVLVFALLMFTLPTQANVQPDLDFVVDVHVQDTTALQNFDALLDKSVAEVEPAIENLGGTVSDRSAFKEALLGDINAKIMEVIRSHWLAEYQNVFSDEEIAQLAEFYRSAEWQSVASEFFSNGALPDDVETLKQGPFSIMIEHEADLDQSMPVLEAQVISELQSVYSLERFAEIFKMDGVVSFESEQQRQDVIDAIGEFLEDCSEAGCGAQGTP